MLDLVTERIHDLNCEKDVLEEKIRINLNSNTMQSQLNYWRWQLKNVRELIQINEKLMYFMTGGKLQ